MKRGVGIWGIIFRLAMVGGWIALIAAYGAMRASAAVSQCDLALVLAMDASVSIKDDQHRLIRDGTASALRHPAIASAFAAGNVMLQVTEYADRVAILVDWTPIRTPADLEAVAATLEQAAKSNVGTSTGMGSAMVHARQQFDIPNCTRNVLDVLSDGESNAGITPMLARGQFREGVDQINGLFVGKNPTWEQRLRDDVIFGPMAFVETTADFEGIGRAMYRKLLAEIAMNLPGRYNG